MYDYYSNRPPSTFNNFCKSINKVHQYATRLIICRKLGPTMGNLISVSVALNCGILLKEDLKSASRFPFKKLLKDSAISKYWLVAWVLYYVQLFVCTAIVLLLCLFVCVYIYLLQFKYFSLCLCVHLFIYYNLNIWLLFKGSYFSAWPSRSAQLAFAISEWLCSLFFAIIFLKLFYSFCIKSTIKICCYCYCESSVRRFCTDLLFKWHLWENAMFICMLW